MESRFEALHRVSTLVVAGILLFGIALVPVLHRGLASALTGQVQSRSIELSDSAPSGSTITTGEGSGTNVTYNVTFTPATTHTIGGIVVDICANSPLIGDTSCTYPASFNWGGAAPSVTVVGGMGSGWTFAGVQAGAGSGLSQVLELSDATAQSLAPGTPVNFTISGVTNPDVTNGTSGNGFSFYARILTFDTAAHMTSSYTTSGTTRTANPITGNIDNGGIAMSTATPITITARVQETLTLCTSAAAPTLGCAGVTTPAITLGHGPNNILDATLIDSSTVYSQLSTNAQSGAIIRMESNTAGCSSNAGGLSKDGGVTCGIPPVNGGTPNGATGTTIVAGTAAFGLQVGGGTAVAGGTGTATIATEYTNTGSNYTFDTTTANNKMTYLYGNTVASTAGAVNGVNVAYTFAATASNTTAAGIYTTAESLIATGTF